MDITIFRSLLGIDPKTNYPISTNYILSTDGFGDLQWQNVLDNISSQNFYLGYLPSTINGLSNQVVAFSTGQLPGTLSTPNLTSTVSWLIDPIRYISSGNLISTTQSIINGTFFNSLVTDANNNLGSIGYISSSQLQSTVVGLGTFGYVSSSTIYSTLTGLGTLGYVSTSYLNNIINNLGSSNYISTASLVSSINNLGSLGYVSSASLFSSINSVNNALFSTTTDILENKQNIYLNATGSLVLGGSNINVTISTVTNFYFYNSFFNSSIKYKGNNSLYTGYNSDYDIYVSTLDTQLDRFSSYTTNTTNLSLDIYPNIIFPQINTNSNPRIYHVSSFIQYNGSTINIQHQTKFLAMNNSASNLFQGNLRINIPGSIINNNYNYPYLLNHRFINSYAFDTNVGFATSNVEIFMDSTSSYYLSIQNIAP